MSARLPYSRLQPLVEINRNSQGQARVLVADDAEPRSLTLVQQPDEPSLHDRSSDMPDTLRVVLDALREQLERERRRADRLERARNAEQEATTKAEVQLEYERGRADQADRAEAQLGRLWETAVQARYEAEATLVMARAAQQAAEDVIAQLRQTEQARRARGLSARLWQALWHR
jgi:hypothetical protein